MTGVFVNADDVRLQLIQYGEGYQGFVSAVSLSVILRLCTHFVWIGFKEKSIWASNEGVALPDVGIKEQGEGSTRYGILILLRVNAHLQFGTCCICSINEKLMRTFEVLLLHLKFLKGFLQDITYPVHHAVSEVCRSTTVLVGNILSIYPSVNNTGCFQMLLNICDSGVVVCSIQMYIEYLNQGLWIICVHVFHLRRMILLYRPGVDFALFLQVPHMLVIDTDVFRMQHASGCFNFSVLPKDGMFVKGKPTMLYLL